MISSSSLFAQSTIHALLEHDPVVQQYRPFFPCLIGLLSKTDNVNALLVGVPLPTRSETGQGLFCLYFRIPQKTL